MKKRRPFAGKWSGFPKSRFGPLVMHELSPAAFGLPYTAMMEILPAGTLVPEVRHRRTDEWILMLEGRMTASVDGRRRLLREGDVLYLPRGTRHQFKSAAVPARALSIFSPAMDPKKPDVEVLP